MLKKTDIYLLIVARVIPKPLQCPRFEPHGGAIEDLDGFHLPLGDAVLHAPRGEGRTIITDLAQFLLLLLLGPHGLLHGNVKFVKLYIFPTLAIMQDILHALHALQRTK